MNNLRAFALRNRPIRGNVALRICLIYALVSSLWILFSDSWLFSFIAERGDAVLISMIKGIAFVLVTSAIIYVLIERGMRAVKQSEASYRTLIETSPDAIALLDLDTRIIMANRQFLSLSGHDRAENLIGKSILDFIAPQDKEPASAGMRLLLRTGETCKAEYTAVRRDGSVFPIESRTSLILDEGRTPGAMMIILRDIAERNQAERELKLLAQTVASTKDCVSITDLEDKVLFVNDAFIETYGYTREELIGQNVSIFRSPSMSSVIGDRILPATLAGGWYGEVMNRRKDGTDFPIELWTSTVMNESDEPVAMVGVARDISARKQVEEALKASESKFRQLIEQAADGVFTADSDGKLLLVNPKACEMLGYTEEELLSLDIRDTYSVEDLALADTRIMSARVGAPSQFERNMRRKDGTVFPVEVSLQLLKDGTFQGVVRDISARKQAEESIRKLYAAIEQSDEVIFMTNVDGTITYVNPAFERVYGFRKDEVIGRTPRLLKSDHLSGEFYKEFWKKLLAGESVHSEHINRSKDGRLITMEASVNPVLDSKGSITGFIAVQNDITARKKADEERKALEQQLLQTQKIESIGTLAGGVAHDFNNILGIILGHATLLNHMSNDPAKFQRSRDSIITAVQRGASLVQQILTFARKTDVLFEPMNLNETVTEFVKMLEETFPKTISFSLHLAPMVSSISADRTQLHQALLNLCVNARDAMPEGGMLSIVTEHIRGEQLRRRFPDAQDCEFVSLSVSDSGTGMDNSTMQRIFEPFFTTKPIGKGTGLGLAVVHGIMKNHHGHIGVESDVGAGTTFRLYFPVPQLEHNSSLNDGRVDGEVVGGEETILFVEDELALCDLVRMLLEAKGYRVLTAHDGEHAISLYTEHWREVALVISDMGLPKISGADVFLQMKAINPDVKVILVSGYLEPETKAKLFRAGTKGFIQKPYVPLEILKRIRDTLEAV